MTHRTTHGDARLVLHLGAHKTGTTLLQKFMTANQAVLQRKGVSIIDRTDMDELCRWGTRMRGKPELLGGRIHDLAVDPSCDVVLASHETMFGHPFITGGTQMYARAPNFLPPLAKIVGGYRTQVIYSIRPQVEMLESYYLQMIHQGRYYTFEQWLERYDLDRISWLPVISQLEETFGADNVDIVDFRLIRNGQEAYIAEFLSRIDPSFDFAVEYPEIKNASISGKGLHMALAANPHLRSTPERQAMRKFLQRYFSNTRFPRPVLLDDEQIAGLHERYDAEYEEIIRTHPRRRPNPA